MIVTPAASNANTKTETILLEKIKKENRSYSQVFILPPKAVGWGAKYMKDIAKLSLTSTNYPSIEMVLE